MSNDRNYLLCSLYYSKELLFEIKLGQGMWNGISVNLCLCLSSVNSAANSNKQYFECFFFHFQVKRPHTTPHKKKQRQEEEKCRFDI